VGEIVIGDNISRHSDLLVLLPESDIVILEE
jgi:hypothetical protein